MAQGSDEADLQKLKDLCTGMWLNSEDAANHPQPKKHRAIQEFDKAKFPELEAANGVKEQSQVVAKFMIGKGYKRTKDWREKDQGPPYSYEVLDKNGKAVYPAGTPVVVFEKKLPPIMCEGITIGMSNYLSIYFFQDRVFIVPDIRREDESFEDINPVLTTIGEGRLNLKAKKEFNKDLLYWKND